MTEELAADVREALDVDTEAFEAQARTEAEVVKSELREGTFNNHQSIVGLEYEFYAVADGRWEAPDDAGVHGLMRVPRRLLELIGFEKELGLHNAEMTISPQPLNADGLRAQESEVRARLSAAQGCTGAEGIRLVSDGMWTIPPAGETARDYLTDSVEAEGVRIGTNMSGSVRYHAMANGPAAREETAVDAANVRLRAETVMPESLITSIQPHYQVAHADDLPTRFNYALRVAGPLVALGANSPFFPPDLYDDVGAGKIIAETDLENRIGVFESVLNTPDARKVAFPEDLDTIGQAVDRHLLAVGPAGVRRRVAVGSQRPDRVPPDSGPADGPGLGRVPGDVCRVNGEPPATPAPRDRSAVVDGPGELLRRRRRGPRQRPAVDL